MASRTRSGSGKKKRPTSGRVTTPGPVRRRRRYPRWMSAMVSGLIIFGGAGVGLAAIASTSSNKTTTQVTPTTAPASGPADLDSRPSFAQVVYEVQSVSGTTTTTSWEVLTANRPFAVSDVTYKSDPLVGAPPATGTISTFDAVYNLTQTHLNFVSGVEPSVGTGDQAIASELNELVQSGEADDLGQTATVAGRTCHEYRFAAPPSGPISPVSGSDHDDLCFDNDGLVLDEQWTEGGRVVLAKEATEVNLTSADPHIAALPALSSAGSPEGTKQAAIDVTPGVNKYADFLAVPSTPPGWTAGKAVAVAVVDSSKPGTASNESTVWSYTEGGNLITVEAGAGPVPWQNGSSATTTVTLTHLGTASVVLTSTGPEVQVPLTGSHWVRIDGTVSPSQLASYANSLALTG